MLLYAVAAAAGAGVVVAATGAVAAGTAAVEPPHTTCVEPGAGPQALG